MHQIRASYESGGIPASVALSFAEMVYLTGNSVCPGRRRCSGCSDRTSVPFYDIPVFSASSEHIHPSAAFRYIDQPVGTAGLRPYLIV